MKPILDQDMLFDDLDTITKSVLIGSILGDGCITTQSRTSNYRFFEHHGAKQSDYLQWKAKMMSVLSANFMPNPKHPTLSTPSHPMFAELRKQFYGPDTGGRGRKQIIPQFVIEQIDILGLLIWFLDDGTARPRSAGAGVAKARIVSTLFSREDLDDICDSLNDRLNVDLSMVSYPRDNKPMVHEMIFNISSINTIFPQWIDLSVEFGLPGNMMYKLIGNVPKEGYVPDRPWTDSEMKTLLDNMCGMNSVELSALLDRTPASIRNKLRRLGYKVSGREMIS